MDSIKIVSDGVQIISNAPLETTWTVIRPFIGDIVSGLVVAIVIFRLTRSYYKFDQRKERLENEQVALNQLTTLLNLNLRSITIVLEWVKEWKDRTDLTSTLSINYLYLPTADIIKQSGLKYKTIKTIFIYNLELEHIEKFNKEYASIVKEMLGKNINIIQNRIRMQTLDNIDRASKNCAGLLNKLHDEISIYLSEHKNLKVEPFIIQENIKKTLPTYKEDDIGITVEEIN